jgi:preprotein translocase subunit SecA
MSAIHLYIRDRDYVVIDDKVCIVDTNTGRVMVDRTWERGLHQMIETKEQCELSPATETVARISYQRFFHRYLMLSGMTGTASEVSGEFSAVYGLNVTKIAPHRACRRVSMPEQIYLNAEAAQSAVVASAQKHANSGQAVLIGTRSVLASEKIANLLFAEGLDVQVLNANQDALEAQIISQAGNAGQITVATNMAGRGTDIHLGPGVESKGGLHVIVTERNDSARVDRQLLGRCARQGDQGSYQCFASLEDDIPRQGYKRPFLNVLARLNKDKGSQMPEWLGSFALNFAQRQSERRHERIRRQVERDDARLDNVLSFSGASE